ncbi:MAG: tRNA methyl transferase PRC-barrel domain-containing protein [bacterium]
MKIAVAMSGGVDSSVAAALMVDKYGTQNVFGVTMKLFCYGESGGSDKSCCSLDAIDDAAMVCKQLGISHYVVNLEKDFEAEIIDNFISEYSQGRTPNPCVRCNSLIKFKHLLRKAQELGADILVTGHYARILPSLSSLVVNPGISSGPSDLSSEALVIDSEVSLIAQTRRAKMEEDPHFRKDDNVLGLFCGLDSAKDQSYFLYNLDQYQLGHIWFPLGELTKPETRKLAEKYALKTAQKTESQDICFVTTTTQDFLSNKIKIKAGNIVDKAGNVLGKHDGIPFYTIGQRKGLGGGFTEPMYVTGFDLVRNDLVVGREEELYDDEMMVSDIHWTYGAPDLPTEMEVKIRYNSKASSASLNTSSEVEKSRSDSSRSGNCRTSNNKVLIRFQKPQKAITPGQTAVFYIKEEVVGGGIIESTRKY